MNVAAFPTHVQIQTSSACGAACSICPHPTESPHWPNRRMSPEVFSRIVEQLRGRSVEYLCPYLMADSMSDRLIFDRIHVLREILPETHFELSTTGLYLAPKLADQLLAAPLDEVRISSHGISAEEYASTMPGVPFDRAMANITRFVERWRALRPFDLSVVSLWGLWSRQREAEIEAFWSGHGVELSKWRVISRADQVDLTVFGEGSADPTADLHAKGVPPYTCRFHRDTQWLHILSDGRVTLCCMDYTQEEILGHVMEQTIEEIWHSNAYAQVRARIRGEAPMAKDSLCARCEWHVSAEAHSNMGTDAQTVARRAIS